MWGCEDVEAHGPAEMKSVNARDVRIKNSKAGSKRETPTPRPRVQKCCRSNEEYGMETGSYISEVFGQFLHFSRAFLRKGKS